MDDIISILLVICFSIVFVFTGFRIWLFLYDCHFRSYKGNILLYFEQKNVVYKGISAPNTNDWETSPFKKPPTIKAGFIQLKFFGFFHYSNIEYTKIKGQKHNKIHEYWMEVKTSVFHNPKITIRKGKTYSMDKFKKTIDTVLVKSNCPACNTKLIEQENICSNCGLHFI
ncbi:MAG: hypothetical protein ACPG4Z_05575 [Chitinophagales bacterium]